MLIRVAITTMAMAIVAGSPRYATADPVDTARWVTSGNYFTEGGQDFFSFVSPTFEFHQTSGATPDKTFARSCNPCVAGDTLDLSFRSPPLDANGVYAQTPLGSAMDVNSTVPTLLWIFEAISSSSPCPWSFPT